MKTIILLSFTLVVTLFLCLETQADTVTHFGDGVGQSFIPSLLNQVGIGSTNAASEVTTESYRVPGTIGDNTQVQLSFVRDTGSYEFTFGYYPTDAVSANPTVNKVGYAAEALQNATVVFEDALVNPGAASTFNLTSGTNLGFFLIPNDSISNVLSDVDAYYDSASNSSFGAKRSPLFSISDANPGEFDQMLSFIGNGTTLFAFEDLTRLPGAAPTSDQDFTDLAFTITPTLDIPPAIPAPIPLQKQGDSLYSLGFLNDTLIISLNIAFVGDDPGATLRQRWEQGAEQIWSDQFEVIDGDRRYAISLDVEFSDTNPDAVIDFQDTCGRPRILPNRFYSQIAESEGLFGGPICRAGYDPHEEMAAHEFGHLLGLYDEYPGPSQDPLNPITDDTSIMGTLVGGMPKERHYQNFLDWFNNETGRNMALGQAPLFRPGQPGPPVFEGLVPEPSAFRLMNLAIISMLMYCRKR